MKNWKKVLCWLLPLVIAVGSLGIGRFEVDFVTVVKILSSHILPIEETWSAMEYNVVMTVRLPRILLALLVGAGLSISGASFQRKPFYLDCMERWENNSRTHQPFRISPQMVTDNSIET